jgi:hypothetical protein
MMDVYEVHANLIENLNELRKQLADSGTGNFTDESTAAPIALRAHKEAEALLKTLQTDEFEEIMP